MRISDWSSDVCSSDLGSDFCRKDGLNRLVWAERGEAIKDCIAHGKRVKRWRREGKFALVEKANPDWLDLYAYLIGYVPEKEAGPRIKSGATGNRTEERRVGKECVCTCRSRGSTDH